MYLISETTASFWQVTNGTLRPPAESPRPLLSSSSSKRKILIAVLVAASVFFIVLFGIGFYLYQKKMKLAREANCGLVNSPTPNEITVEYRAHDPSIGGSLSSCESTAPLMRQPSLRSRLASNLIQVSEEDMPLDSPTPNEITVEYKAHDPSVGGSLSSCESTAPLMRQPSLRSRLASNLIQVSEEDMPLDSPTPNEITVEYKAHDPSVGGSLSSCESTAPLMRQPSLRSRLASNLIQVSEEDMPLDSPTPNEITVEYKAHDPSVGGSLSSCESTAPLMRQPSLRSRLASNLTQVSEEDMSLDEKWEIDRELISLQEVLGEGAFGRVMKAEVLGMPNMPFRLNVAVKMLKGKFCILAITGKDTSAFIANFLTIIVLKCSIRFL